MIHIDNEYILWLLPLPALIIFITSDSHIPPEILAPHSNHSSFIAILRLTNQVLDISIDIEMVDLFIEWCFTQTCIESVDLS